MSRLSKRIDVEAGVDQPAAELLVPREHLRREAHHEQQGAGRGVAEGLVGEGDAVGVDGERLGFVAGVHAPVLPPNPVRLVPLTVPRDDAQPAGSPPTGQGSSRSSGVQGSNGSCVEHGANDPSRQVRARQQRYGRQRSGRRCSASKEALSAPRTALSAGVERRRSRPRSILVVRAGIAAAVAYVVAQQLRLAPSPVLAPLTALLVVQATLQETFVSGLQRLLSVLAGVLLASTLSAVVGLTPWSLCALVIASLGVGKVLRLGANVVEVPISAMVVLAVHGQAGQAHLRIGETVVGTVVGVAANLILLPPVYLEPSVRAVRDLAAQTQELLLLMSFGLRDGWSAERAQAWLVRSPVAEHRHHGRPRDRRTRRAERPVQPARPRQSASPGPSSKRR